MVYNEHWKVIKFYFTFKIEEKMFNMLVLFKTFQQYIQIFSSLFKGRRSLAYNLFLVYNKSDIVINKPHIIKALNAALCTELFNETLLSTKHSFSLRIIIISQQEISQYTSP